MSARFVVAVTLMACGSRTPASTPPPVCSVVAPTQCPSPPPRYSVEVAPIIQAHCLECHAFDNADGNWPLADYAHVADWSDAIRADLLDCTMPPADSDTAMGDDERTLLLEWIRCETPK